MTDVKGWIDELSPLAQSILMAAAALERVFREEGPSGGRATVEAPNTGGNAEALDELTSVLLRVAPPSGVPEDDKHTWRSLPLTMGRTQFRVLPNGSRSVVAWHVGLGMGVLEQIEQALEEEQ